MYFNQQLLKYGTWFKSLIYLLTLNYPSLKRDKTFKISKYLLTLNQLLKRDTVFTYSLHEAESFLRS